MSGKVLGEESQYFGGLLFVECLDVTDVFLIICGTYLRCIIGITNGIIDSSFMGK